MGNPVKFEINILVEMSDNNVLSSRTKVFVDAEQIGVISRLRVDHDSDETLPIIEIDLLRGIDPDIVPENSLMLAKRSFELLKRVPGVKCVMHAPRKT